MATPTYGNTMELFYIFNIAAYLLTLLITPIYFSRRFRLGAWNLLTIPLLVQIPLTSLTSFSGPYFFLSKSLFNPYFQYALLINNFYVLIQSVTVIFLVSYIINNKAISRRIEKWMAQTGVAVRPRMIIASWLFLGLFVASFLLLTQSFGLLNWIADPRSGYQGHRSGSGQWYALAVTFLSVSLILATVYVRSSHFILLLAPVYLVFASLLGSKGYTIAFAIYIVIILALRRYTYLKPVAIIIGAVSGAIVVSNFVNSFGGFGFKEISQYSDYYVNAAMYYESYLTGKISLFHGEVSLSNLWALVPRSVYPNKPYVYGMIKVNEIFYPGAAEQTNTPAFATVDKFADFGWFQVLFSALLAPQNLITAFLYVVVLQRLGSLNVRNGIAHPRLLTYCFIIMNAPFFLMYFEFPFDFIMICLIFGLINLVNQIKVSQVKVIQSGETIQPPVSGETLV